MYNNSIKKFDLNIKNVPLRIFRPANQNYLYKTIIHYHGWSSSIEKYELLGQIYALHGYQFILVEIDKHGQRGNAKDYSSFYEAPRVLHQTFMEFEEIKEEMIKNLNIDKDNLGISGHSLGAMIAMSIFARHRDIRLGLIYNGLADFDRTDAIVTDPEALEKIKSENKFKQNYKYNPVQYLDNFNNRNLYIMIGDLDKVINPLAMEEFEIKLKDKGINTDNIHFIHFPEASHSISYRMVNTALDFCLDTM